MSAPRTLPASRTALTAVLLGALVLLAVATLASVTVGTRVLSPAETFAGLLGHEGVAATVIWELRLPRTLLGLLVGCALGVAGVLAQAVTRNPLADPGLLGISAGGAVAVVAGSAFLGLGAGIPRVLLALAGAALATAAVYLFASRSPEGLTPVNMTLAGMAMTAFLAAAVSATVLLSASTMDQYRFWVVGALDLPDPAVLLPAIPPAVAGAILAMVVSGSLNALALGDDTAAALGVAVVRTRLLAGAAVVLLSGTAVALAGPIAFVGLVIPHIARALVGTDVRRVLALSAVLGPLLLVTADVVGRLVARPAEVQVGVVTALLGTPFFIWLTRRAKERAQ
ncbi:FecCD family ABC transporter permease [Promicromonospora panici]|uniref:FecCD family ABC transporter permease n=1 Tax=Promicromonospora panici TaxID=2219658 RepID=UPI00101B98BC|nr:iron ABC transporter permease [Promicromonospora panici]